MLRMRHAILATMLVASVGASVAQMRPSGHEAKDFVPHAAATQVSQSVDGKWSYRSYLNQADVMVNGDANKALSLLFGEGVMTLAVGTGGVITGTFDMGGNYVLDLKGTQETLSGGQVVIHLSGPGRLNSPTSGWEYDYLAYLTPMWPTGIDQVPALVGTVLRAKPHGTGKAGVTASFIAVKQGG